MARRDEVLRATAAAASVLAAAPPSARTSFDIVGAVVARGIPLVFRPLEGLLGANIRCPDGTTGIVVTTRRSLAIQRFTLAHELGHVLLGHEPHLDTRDTVRVANYAAARSLPEVGANTFASALLGAKCLILELARRHVWTKEALRKPENVYQLALRLGLSYKATCWALRNAAAIAAGDLDNLMNHRVKSIKQALDPMGLLTDYRTDVWKLTEADRDTCIEASPHDLFAVTLSDHASAGYVWRLADTGADVTLVDDAASELDCTYGGRSRRSVYLRFGRPGVHNLVFEHVRPWNNTILARMAVEVHALGNEVEGLARRERERALASAA